jgi:hypothetical protein
VGCIFAMVGLIGLPIRVNVGVRKLKHRNVQTKARTANELRLVGVESLRHQVMKLLFQNG